MLDRHHQLTGSFLHDHYSVIAINAIFLTILDGNGTRDMWVGGWLTAMARMVCGRVTHCNGMHGMRVADSLQWHAWYADA